MPAARTLLRDNDTSDHTQAVLPWHAMMGWGSKKTDRPGKRQEVYSSLANKPTELDGCTRSNWCTVAAALLEFSVATNNPLTFNKVPLIGLQLFLLNHTPPTLRALVSDTQPACRLCSQAAAGTRSCKHKSDTTLTALLFLKGELHDTEF